MTLNIEEFDTWNIDIRYFQRYLNSIEKATLRKFQVADEALYYHFSKILQEKIRKFGRDDMSSAVKDLDEMNSHIRASCVKDSEYQEAFGTELLITKPE